MSRPPTHVAALILAGGRSSRMGKANKLLADLDGRPLVTHVVEAALSSRADPVLLVTGHAAAAVAAAVAGRPVRLIHAPDWADGLSATLRAGLCAVPDDRDGVAICLGDMPGLTAGILDRLLDAFDPDTASIVAPMAQGRRGNPVVWARRHIAELMRIEGDTGGRALLCRHAEAIHTVLMEDVGVLTDIDTPDALDAWRNRG